MATIDNVPHEFICPISYMIFLYPVVSMDGNTYEKDHIKKWFEKSNNSPKTNQKIDKTIIINRNLKIIIDEYLEKNPDMKQFQYINTDTSIETDTSIQSDNSIHYIYYYDYIYYY